MTNGHSSGYNAELDKPKAKLDLEDKGGLEKDVLPLADFYCKGEPMMRKCDRKNHKS